LSAQISTKQCINVFRATRGVIGGALIVIGVVVSELRVRRKDKAAVATEAD
jgi:hypothetical protein